MRVSIWQQFSSNHSASFTVVGQFESHQAAQVAAAILRQAGRAIQAWYDANEEIREKVIRRQIETPTDAELRVCEQYGITCDKALDWLANCGFSDENVTVYQGLVCVSNAAPDDFCDGWAGEALFDQLMAKLAIKVAVEEENSSVILVTVECVAPNAETAEAIHNMAEQYLAQADEMLSKECPWFLYYSGSAPVNPTDFLRDYRIYLTRRRAEMQWYKADMKLQQDQPASDEITPNDKAERARQDVLDRQARQQEALQGFEELPFVRQHRVLNAMLGTSARFFPWEEGNVTVDQRQILFNKLNFSHIATGLPALIAWLSDQGCTDFQYSFEQH